MTKKVDIFDISFLFCIGIELEFYTTSPAVIEVFLTKSELVNHSCFGRIEKEKGLLQYELITKPVYSVVILSEFFINFKKTLITLATSLNEQVFFDAKPFKTQPGSSLHVNVSLFDYKKKIFLAKTNQFFYFAIGGLCSKLKKTMVYFAPKPSSYKRFFSEDINVPRIIGWGFNNRSVALRIPFSNPARIEHRVGGADCDIKQILSIIIGSIMYGINNKIAPPLPTYGVPQLWVPENIRLPLSYTEANKERRRC